MTVTYYNEKTGEVYGSFTAAGRNGQFLKAQKMKMASLRIKLLEDMRENCTVVMVMVVTDTVAERRAL